MSETGRDERFEKVGEEFSTAATHAASVFEEELAAGIASVRRVQERADADRRLDPAAFDEVVGRVRKDGHALIDMVAARIPEDEQRGELVRRYTADAHDVLDTVLNLARLTPDIANGLIDRVSDDGPSGPHPRRAGEA